MEPFITDDDDGQRWVGVRIPVAVNTRGQWFAWGIYWHNRDQAHEVIMSEADREELGAVDIHYVYARVPIGEHRVFEGEVKGD